MNNEMVLQTAEVIGFSLAATLAGSNGTVTVSRDNIGKQLCIVS